MPIKVDLINGRYLYKKDGREYSEENFKFQKADTPQGNIYISSEILSRVSTGEFLKVYVNYELTCEFDPLELKIRRSLGRRQSIERYKINLTDHSVKYHFRGDSTEERFEKFVNGKFFISAPSFCTSMLMTMGKRFDPLQKTQYHIVSSRNIWNYEGPFTEQYLFVEQVQAEQVELTLNNQNLKSTYVHVYEQSKDFLTQEVKTPFFLSKHFNLPYKANLSDEVTIEVDKLRVNDSKYKGMFG